MSNLAQNIDNPGRLIVPVSILSHSLKMRVANPLRLYLAIKVNGSSSRVNFNYQSLLSIKDKRTYLKHLNWLISNNWIGTDGQHLFPRSWNRIISYYNLKGHTGIELRLEYLFNTEIFKAWATGAIITTMINWQKRKARYFRELFKRGSQPRRYRSTPAGYYGLANVIIARQLDCSIPHASRLKNLAAYYGFIKTKHKVLPFSQGYSSDFPYLFTEYPMFFSSKGMLFYQSYDEIIPKIKLRTKKNL